MIEHRESSYTVKLQFAPVAARYIREKNWHESQKIEELPDGGCILELVTQSLDEMQRWVLTFGCDVTVLEPKELVQSVKVCVRKTLLLYEV